VAARPDAVTAHAVGMRSATEADRTPSRAANLFAFVLVRRGVPDRNARLQESAGVRDAVRGVAGLIRTRPELKAFLAANALWELSLAALKTFVVLYVIKGARATAARSRR
jgi:hypothetical protein